MQEKGGGIGGKGGFIFETECGNAIARPLTLPSPSTSIPATIHDSDEFIQVCKSIEDDFNKAMKADRP